MDPAIVLKMVPWFCAQAGPQRSHPDSTNQRTLSSHRKMPLGKLESGWLSPLTEHEYRAVVEAADDSHCEVPHPHDPIQVGVSQTQAETGVSCMHLL